MTSQMIDAHNQIRHSSHLPHLYFSRRLQQAAQTHCNRMAKLNQLSHEENLSGRKTVGNRAHQAGYHYSAVGENIASGQTSVGEVMQGWMNSPGHRRNILNGTYRHIGAAIAQSANGTCFWCVVLGREMGR
ncbi:unnamed protein product [Rotaria sordida]|uniref:SCP domain-containing protein n=1 Tax=Rotaria sordida TaxID=392033 RepID=A0A814Q6F1_9BILA|nr:unnamed protein product [Rotaria sordida]